MISIIEEVPNTVAERLTGRPYISYSAISTFRQCPLKYRFRYIDGLEEESVSAAMIFGGAIHAAVELHFNELLAGNPAPDIDALLFEYQAAWRERDLGKVQFNKTDDVDSLGLLAERMLRAFQENDFSNPSGAIIGVEEELRGELVEGCPDLLARIDLVTNDGDALTVTDLKTARSRWGPSQVDSNAEQLLLYSELAGRLVPGQKVRLQFAVITKAKSPAVEVHDVDFDRRRLNRTKRMVKQVWSAIQAKNFYPNPSPMNCPSCPYRSACRAWNGEQDPNRIEVK